VQLAADDLADDMVRQAQQILVAGRALGHGISLAPRQLTDGCHHGC
jgi:hypothetical protein